MHDDGKGGILHGEGDKAGERLDAHMDGGHDARHVFEREAAH